ncbi:MAG: NUDIX hydrolase [Pseudomonadota bacterium]
MNDVLNRNDWVRPGSGGGDEPDAPSTQEQSAPVVTAEFPSPDDKKSTVSENVSRYRAFTLIRKRTFFGYVYFLEKRKKDESGKRPGKYGLFGGNFERDDSIEDEYVLESSMQTALRELEEELGIDDFGDASPKEIFKGFSLHDENRQFQVHLFLISGRSAKKVNTWGIRRHQKEKRAELKVCQQKRQDLLADKSADHSREIEDLDKDIKTLKDQTSAGKPVKIRRCLGTWWGVPLADLTPLAAYALLADASFRRHQ